jgi:hypothetical protein
MFFSVCLEIPKATVLERYFTTAYGEIIAFIEEKKIDYFSN